MGVALVSIPAVFDIIATALSATGFIFLPASVWQLLRGAEVVFAALFAVVFLGRSLYAVHWVGLLLCTLGIFTVGASAIWNAAASEEAGLIEEGSENQVLIGMSLALAGQVVQAGQVVAEEWLLKDLDLPALQIVGFEGVWGVGIMTIILSPFLYIIPGFGHGHLEDEVDAATMVASSATLATLICVYIFCCFAYNLAGITVTGVLSSVHRVMLEAFRTCAVWFFGLYVHYFVSSTSLAGESFTRYSSLQVLGFIIIICGQTIYIEILRMPCLWNPPKMPGSMFTSPGNIRNFASPLPRDCKIVAVPYSPLMRP